MTPRLSTERARWWQVFLSLFVAIGAWALVAPLGSGHDEGSHFARGASLVRGELLGSKENEDFPGVLITVQAPEAYHDLFLSGCYKVDPALTPACSPPLGDSRALEPTSTIQYRSPPGYYLVALPSLLDAGRPGMYATRLVSAALCAAFLASAVASARRLPRPGFGLLGVAVAITPEVLYLSASMSSNGLETATAVSLWATLAALACAPEPSADLVRRAGVALTVLVGTRGLSPAFGVVIVGTMAVVAGAPVARTWASRREARAWVAAAGLVAAVSLAYVVAVQRWLPISRPGQGLAHAWDRLPWYLRQGVGLFSANDLPLPDAVYATWAVAVVGLVGLALTVATRREALVVLAVAAGGIGLQLGAEGFAVPPIGFFWQGRYALPILTGVPVLAGCVLSRHGDRLVRAERLVPAGLVILGVGHLVSHLQAVRRFAVTLDGPANPWRYLRDPVWSPPTGPAALWIALFAIGLAAAGWLATRPSAAAA